MKEFQPPPANATPLPVADVAAATSAGNVEYETYPVRKPEEDLNDFKVQVRASTLTRCRAKLNQISDPRFPWHEVALGASTLATGAFLGALPADIKAGTPQAVFFYTVLPIIAVGAFVAYLFLRRLTIVEPTTVAADVLSELPDPHKAR
jgi:hypothetical protein